MVKLRSARDTGRTEYGHGHSISSRLDQQWTGASHRLARVDGANKMEQQRELDQCLHHFNEKCRPGAPKDDACQDGTFLELAQPSPMPIEEE